jgi:hypothetical protein
MTFSKDDVPEHSQPAYGVVRSQTKRRELAALAGFGTSVLVGAAKEGLDLAGLGTPSWTDFAWDAIGAAVGVLLSLGVDIGVSAAFGNAVICHWLDMTRSH